MKLLKPFLVGIAASAVCAVSQASVLNFEYVALANNQFQSVSGDFGANVGIGDTVTFKLTTQAGQQFQTVSSDYMWSILGIVQAATRDSDYSWSFYNDGALVGSGSASQSTSFVHMGPFVNTGFDGYFDEYEWTGVLLSSTNNNVNTAYDFVSPGSTTAVLVADSVSVPEPSALALVMAGLAGLVAVRSKRNAA